MAVNFTKNQQAAIDIASSNILVSAAAGSGKTAVLSERVIRLLTGENPIDANRLVIVTFTVLAAEEMRQRISKKLSVLVAKDPTNKHLQAQQLMLASAKICTIHSLCSSLIRDNFQTLGLASDFRIADETELTIIKNEAVDEVFSEYYDVNDQKFLDLVEFTCVKNDTRLVELILSVYDFVRSFPFPKQFFVDCLSMYDSTKPITESIWYQSIVHHVDDALKSAVLVIDSALDLMSSDETVKSAYSPSFDYDRLQIMAICSSLSENNWDKARLQCKNYQKLPLKAVRNYEDKEFLEDIKSRRKSAHDIVGTVSEKYLMCSEEDFKADILVLTPVIETLFETITAVYDLIEQKKLEQSVIDYADLEHYTLKLLIKEGTTLEKSDIGLELCNSFDEIMVDECQDINEVQNLIFKLLSKDERNIFMVGDVKQSIYRFRKAMPSLFIEKKNAFPIYNANIEQNNACIILHDNFRSRAEVCNTVNLIFSQIMSENMGEIEYDESEHLVAAAQYNPNSEAYSEVHIIDSTNNVDKPAIELEAQYLSRLIQNMVSNGYTVEENGKTRPCRYGDFAILLRAKKGKSEIYTNELKKLNINSFSDATEGYFNEYEIAVTLNLLRIIDNPLQDICLSSVLMSPMFSFDADMVAQVRISKKNTPLYLAMLEYDNDACRECIEAISKLRRLSTVCTVEELVQAIYDKTDFISMVYAMGNGEQRDANLRLLLTYAKQYENMGSCGLSGFLRYIDRVIRNKQDFSCANTLTKNADAVKIMSIHSSKGLEFPICILADCGKGFNTMDINLSYQLNSKLGFGMKIVDKPTLRKFGNLPFEAIRLATLKETISEEMRSLYVALTRAREKLIMVMTMGNPDKKIKSIESTMSDEVKLSPYVVFSAKSYADWILMSIVRHSELKLNRNVSTIKTGAEIKLIISDGKTESVLSDSFAGTHIAPIDIDIADRLTRTFQFQYKHNELTKIPAKLTATQMSKQEKEGVINLKVNPTFLQNQGLSPAMRGTILHSFMQYADFDKASVNLDAEINRLVSMEFLSSTQAEALNRKKIEAFLHSDLYSEMKCADKVLREYKFLHFINASDVYDTLDEQTSTEEIMLQGIADCVIIKASKITVVDYKTDYTDDEAVLIERYRNQLAIYKSAIEQAFNLPVVSCKIYSLHMERAIEVV